MRTQPPRRSLWSDTLPQAWLIAMALVALCSCSDTVDTKAPGADLLRDMTAADSGTDPQDATTVDTDARDIDTHDQLHADVPDGSSLDAQLGDWAGLDVQQDANNNDQDIVTACGDLVCDTDEDCVICAADCGACPMTETHQTEFVTWNLYNNAGCSSSNGVAQWTDRNNGPGPLSIRDTLQTQNPAILALQEDGLLGPSGCTLGSVKDKVTSWLSSSHDVRSTDDVGGSASGERYGIFIRRSRYRFVASGYEPCFYGGSEVRGFMWAEVDLIADNTSNHFYVLNAHFKARRTPADVAQRRAQAQCVIDWVQARKVTNPRRAHFLLGDLNSGPDHNNEAYDMLTGPEGPFENTSTAGVDDINTHGDHWIDHILGTRNDFAKAGYGTWTVGEGQVQNGGTLSDHLGLRTRIGHLR